MENFCFSLNPKSPQEIAAIVGAIVFGAMWLVGWITSDERYKRKGSWVLKLVQTVTHGPENGIPYVNEFVRGTLGLLPTLLSFLPKIISRIGGIRG